MLAFMVLGILTSILNTTVQGWAIIPPLFNCSWS
jgi:hypothetical protein